MERGLNPQHDHDTDDEEPPESNSANPGPDGISARELEETILPTQVPLYVNLSWSLRGSSLRPYLEHRSDGFWLHALTKTSLVGYRIRRHRPHHFSIDTP